VRPVLRLRRLAYRAAHAGLRAWWWLRRPTNRGVKLVLEDDGGRVLLVRHTYGDRDAWELPGGGLHRGEAPQDAAAREAHEELGVSPSWAPFAAVPAGGDGKVTTLHVFAARHDGTPLRVDAGELAEVRWADLAAPPLPLGRDARAVLDRWTHR
jgi:8-oxo-dGTP pyrophosphatase MutT (NUDIX family)